MRIHNNGQVLVDKSNGKHIAVAFRRTVQKVDGMRREFGR
jgi:hypothetical protein